MAATVEIDESNGAVQTVTHAIAQSNYGAVDDDHLNVATPANMLTPGQNSFEKWHRIHVTDLAGSAGVQALKFWASGSPQVGWTHHFNGSTVQAVYDSANHKQTVYAQPATTSTRTPETMPVAEPGGPNFGIAGSLAGAFSAPGSSDYLLHQVRTVVSVVTLFSLTLFYGFEDLA